MSSETELEEVYDFLLKLILIGQSTLQYLPHPVSSDSGVGKSALLHQFIYKRSRTPAPHTIGVEFASTLLHLSAAPSSSSLPTSSSTAHATAKTLKCQIFDTAGQERFRSVTRNYYRGSSGAVVVFDITSRASFESLSSWLADARALAPGITIVLVGNKLDREEERKVSYMEASEFAKSNGVLFLETSSLSGENATQPFILLARSILLAVESGRLDPEKPGSGVIFGERRLRRMSSWSSGGKGRGIGIGSARIGGGCC